MYIVRNKLCSRLISGNFYPTCNNITSENFPIAHWTMWLYLKTAGQGSHCRWDHSPYMCIRVPNKPKSIYIDV